MASDKKCIKLPREICSNMNIVCDTKSSLIVLWSKYQLLLYDKANLERTETIDLDFRAKKVLFHNNHLLCLDIYGHMNIMNINEIVTNLTPEPFSGIFYIRGPDNIIACETLLTKQCVVSLQYKNGKFKVFVNKFIISFDCHCELELNFLENSIISNICKEESIIICDIIDTQCLKQIEHQFNVKESTSEQVLLVFTLDRMNIYGCIFNETMKKNEAINVIKLYKSNTKIVDLKWSSDLAFILGLSGGHIIKVSLINNNQKPDVFHLHTPLFKLCHVNNTVIFTDGLTMWKTENLFSKSDFQVKQFFVKNIRDFCVMGKQLFCTTFSNLLYSFLIDQDNVFIQPLDISCEAKLVTDSDCLRQIMDTSHKNEEIIKKYNRETEYLTVLSLSKRQDIMDSFICVTAEIFNNYMDIPQQDANLILTDNIKYYFDSQSYYFHIKLTVLPIQHKLNRLLSDILGDLKIHIILLKDRVLKTTTIQVSEQLKNKNFVIPLKRNRIQCPAGVQIHIILVTSLPAKLDESQKQWMVLYRKGLQINPRQFIKTQPFTNSTCLKEDAESLDTMICKSANYFYGLRYRFNLFNKISYKWSFYLKLPSNYNKILCNDKNYRDHLNSTKIYILTKKNSIYKSSSNWLEFEVGDEKVVLSIEEDDLMKISCPNIYIAMDIRNLFSDVIFSANRSDSEKKNLNGARLHAIDLKLYTDTENLKREIINWLSLESDQEFSTLLSSFHKTIFGSLPI